MGFEKLSPDILRQHKGISFTGITTVFLCHDGQGRIFLAQRSKKARDEHGRWDPGAGGLKHGVSVEENMLRELKEEYDTEPLRSDFIGYFDAFRKSPSGKPSHWVALVFAVLVKPAKVKINEPEMLDNSGWFTLDSLPTPMHSQFKIFLDKYEQEVKVLINQPL